MQHIPKAFDISAFRVCQFRPLTRRDDAAWPPPCKAEPRRRGQNGVGTEHRNIKHFGYIVVKLVLMALVSLAVPATWAQGYRAHAELEKLFIHHNITGTLAIKDERRKEAWVYDMERAKQRFSPASTFKIAHTLFALEGGAIKDEFHFITWDGISRGNTDWDKHQNLRTAFRDSVVWVYQDFAKSLGASKEQRFLNRAEYGNQTLTGPLDQFWLNGSLAISAFEQVAFLQKLYKNALPFPEAHQRLVKDLMLIKADNQLILRGKTGWAAKEPTHIGWFVGWLETRDGPVFFALNMDMPNKKEDLPKRKQLVEEALVLLQALEGDNKPTKPLVVAPLPPVETQTLPITNATEPAATPQAVP